ncbi:signal transduction histidine kinase [Paenibacillus jamilae]|jgi:signal transduction histidine kinase|uniref:sensor histidine kinase n=1 Tax=Paenibacillus polymyxa TaxID=1406 RepID=UPI0008C5FEBC|nr:HAMP domain-containing sensor histidine kinase [Paenibacillus polymyxa]MDP9678778.1 signal transduction histidine kinase [Paenibacillus jamilae]MBY0022501.1 HAMP domain-containing histidine kinase [Paenibacillus polymyxa]MBY0058623.1 HAMP domain-containing histidine kinase [Paenibacillus polymyxa]MBY0072068.1 HAMP domain-containing histidine kinase [Paenibacillus polymyxa]MBY0082960.1 HAMP domain-containing histidine kinase [Paenibacillus polymyxa]
MIRKISIKFLIGFFLIFSLSFVVLNQTVKEFIQTSNQNLVTSELVGLKNNSNVYVRQAFLINHFSSNELYFGEIAREIATNLNHTTDSSIGVYTVEGKLLYAPDSSIFQQQMQSDLQQAIDGNTAYSITYDRNKTTVLFSYPVVIDGSKVGILRFYKDFSSLYEQTGQIRQITLYIALAIFAAAFLFSYILSRHITIPLTRLTQASTEVKNGNLDIRLHFKRRDEIGRLAENFNDMIGQISRQIHIIEKDRDHLKQLHQQEKRFFDNITHELKTPLTSILGYAELIRLNGEKDRAFFDKGMNHIIEESRRLHAMVLKLLEVSRKNIMLQELERVDIGLILQDVCESMMIRSQRYKKTIEYEINEELIMLADRDRIRQMFINLIDNAIKYSLPFSAVSVKAVRAEEKIRLIFSNPSDPIEAEHLSRLLQPFYPAHSDSAEEGSVGLGLSIVKSIVEELAGSILITNEHNETIVTVEFKALETAGNGE